MSADHYETQALPYSCIPASVTMILRRYGHDVPTQQTLINEWCAAGEATRDVIVTLRTPLQFRAMTTFLGEPRHAELLRWLERGSRWIISFVSNYGLACIARLHKPEWTSQHGALAQLYEDDALDLRGALVRLNTLLPSHALVLCGYNRERGQIAALDPFHDGAPRPVWIDEALLEQISTGHYCYPISDL
jgi:hypothetical protein